MKSNRKIIHVLISILVMISILLLVFGNRGNHSASSESVESDKVKVGIAWRADVDSEFYTNICTAIEEADGIPILLNQVIDYDLKYDNNLIADEGVNENAYLEEDYAKLVKNNTYQNSNVEEVVPEVDAVIFTGGEDISPTLLKDPEPWHGIMKELDYNATRDVSDYLLLAYCIDHDIPTMGFCRGMQMLAVIMHLMILQ